MIRSEGEELLMLHIKCEKLPIPIQQFKFSNDRKWKSDFCWPIEKLICEVEGGSWSRGRHVRPLGFDKDCEKYNEATLLGYRVLRVTTDHVKNGKAIEWLKRCLT